LGSWQTVVGAGDLAGALGPSALWFLFMLRKARSAEWFVIASALIPIALSVAVSMWDTKIFSLRYFPIAHLFFLVALCHSLSLRRKVIASL
jgi:hypothetical protein